MKKIIASSMIAFAIFSQTAFGAVYKVISNGEIEYTGKAEKGDVVSVMVFKPGKSYSDIEKGKDLSYVFAACKESVADSEGIYTVKFKLAEEDAASGLYPVYAGYGKLQNANDTIYYVNKSNYEQKTAQFVSADDKAGFIIENVYDMALEPELINSTYSSEICKVYDKSFGTKELTNSQITAGINKSAAIVNFNKGNIPIFGDYEELFEIDDDLYVFINKNYVSDIKKRIEEKMNHDSTSSAEFDENLCKSLVLACIENADGYGDVGSVLNAYGDKFGIDRKKINEYVCKRLVGNSYTENNLKKSVEDFYQDSKEDGDKGSTHGGGGSSNVKVPSITVEPSKNIDTPEPYKEDLGAFSDLNGYDWAKAAIEKLSAMGVLRGRESKKFCPEQNVLREEFIKMIMEGVNFASLTGEFEMDDVSENDWYYPYVKNAYIAGIVKGIDNNKFGVGLNITREDMAVMLFNALNKKGLKLTTADSAGINLDGASDYAVEAILALAKAGIVHGDGNGNFNPKSNTTRAEAAVIVYNALMFSGGIDNE